LQAEQQNAEGLQLEYMKAFTDTGNVGPQVKLSQIALNMKTASKHPPQNILDTYRCESLNIDREFLPSQIVGATYMLQRTCGMVPNPASSDEVDASTANDVRQNQLRSLRTFGGLIVDGTGMGKSDTALLFASWYSRYGDHTDEQGQPCHRPGVLLCPTGTVEQWFKLIAHHYKDLAPILCHGERPPKGESGNWVSATAMRQGPENMTHWPTKLKYVFQKDQPKASQAIFISSYDTFPGRSLAVDWRKSRKEKNDFEDRKPVYKPRYVGCFAYSILDEGHRVRHDDTEAYKSVKLTQCPVNWFLTATPVVNHPDVRSCSSD
jgi:SNF2 family DNA or RNA helicase